MAKLMDLELTEKQIKWIERMENMWPVDVNWVQKMIYIIEWQDEISRKRAIEMRKLEDRVKDLEELLTQYDPNRRDAR